MTYCTYCGNQIPEGASFCSICGAVNKSPIAQQTIVQPTIAQPPLNSGAEHHTKKRSWIGYILVAAASIIFTISVLLLTGLINISNASPKALEAGKLKEVSFQEPEDAVEYYVKNLKAGDLNEMLAACDLNEKAENYDFDKQYDRLKCWTYNSMLPSDYDSYVDINRYIEAGWLIRSIKNQYLALTAPDSEAVQTILNGETVLELGDFTTDMIDPSLVSGLTLERMELANPELQRSSRNQENMKKVAQIYGGDDFTEYIALLNLEDDYYAASFLLYHYDSGWKITAFQSYLTGVDTITPVTLDEYEELISN